MTNAPAACMAHMLEFVNVSVEQKALAEVYCGYMIGIAKPINKVNAHTRTHSLSLLIT